MSVGTTLTWLFLPAIEMSTDLASVALVPYDSKAQMKRELELRSMSLQEKRCLMSFLDGFLETFIPP